MQIGDMMRRPGTRSVLLLTALLAALSPVTKAAPPGPGALTSPAAAADIVVRYYETVLADNFTPEDRAQTEAVVARQMREDPATAARNLVWLQSEVRHIEQNRRDMVWLERRRQKARVALQDRPLLASEQHIIDEHDPVVINDVAHQRLVTRHTIVALVESTRWVADAYHLPPPDAGFAARETDMIRTSWGSLPEAQQQALADLPANWMAFQQVFHAMKPERQAHLLAVNRAGVATTEQAANLAINLAQAGVPFYDRNVQAAIGEAALHAYGFALRTHWDTFRTLLDR